MIIKGWTNVKEEDFILMIYLPLWWWIYLNAVDNSLYRSGWRVECRLDKWTTGFKPQVDIKHFIARSGNCRAFENQQSGLERPAVGPYFK